MVSDSGWETGSDDSGWNDDPRFETGSSGWETGARSTRGGTAPTPTGILVVAALGGFFSLLTLGFGLLMVGSAYSFAGFVGGLFMVFLGGAFLYIDYGLYRLAPWAWLWYLLVGAVFVFLNLLLFDPFALPRLLFWVVSMAYVFSLRDLYQ